MLTAACGGERAVDRVHLRFAPAPGTTVQYVFEQSTAMLFEGGPISGMRQRVNMRLFLTERITGAAPGGIAVQVTFDSVEALGLPFDDADLEPLLRRLRGLTGQLVVDERMRVVGATFEGLAGVPAQWGEQLGSTVRGMVFPFPNGPVGVGDSWTEDVELPLTSLPGNPGPVRARTTVTLRELRVEGADTTAVLAVVSVMPKDPIRVRANNGEATIRLTGSLEGEQSFSLTRGMPSTAAMAGELRISVRSDGDGSDVMGVVLDQQIDMRTAGEP
jgi:hypothetical protein